METSLNVTDYPEPPEVTTETSLEEDDKEYYDYAENIIGVEPDDILQIINKGENNID